MIFDFLLENSFIISTEMCDAVTKNDYIITCFSYQLTVSLFSRYIFPDTVVFVGLLFELRLYCSTFAVSCTSSSTVNYCSNQLGESTFSFN